MSPPPTTLDGPAPSLLVRAAQSSRQTRIATFAIVLAVALGAGAGVAKADSEVGMGIPAATMNDTQLECSNGSFAVEFPQYASGRWSYFAYTFDQGQSWGVSSYYYYSGTSHWEWTDERWQSDFWSGVSLPGGGTVEAYEARNDGNGWYWVYLGSCDIWSYYGPYDFNYQSIYG